MPNNMVHHEHIVGQWEPVNGQLRNKQTDAVDWFENTMPAKFINDKLTMRHDDDAIWYWVGFRFGEAFTTRGIVRIDKNGHIGWDSMYHVDDDYTDRSFLNPVDAVTWILFGPLNDKTLLTEGSV